MPAGLYTIKAASEKSGVSAHTIRAWERRYSALTPNRSETNRRFYTDADVERLKLLRAATERGHSIARIANVDEGDIRQMLGEEARLSDSAPQEPRVGIPPAELLNECLTAAKQLDARRLDSYLRRAATQIGAADFVEVVFTPLMRAIGDEWKAGNLSIAAEHLSTAVFRNILDEQRSRILASEGAPLLLATTPLNQHHELGALMTALLAAADGWRTLYLGPNMPSEEIAAAAKQSDARAIALSLTLAENQLETASELQLLRELVGPAMTIIVGGQACENFSQMLESIGAQRPVGSAETRHLLRDLAMPG